ncbi:hypothetical protein SY88_09545 [Clostridiales bacterium PH28_bin88]|nr:hypothetical protein SY88_09545 [Clostridiales bacterium PH28_bin88]
MPPIRVLLADDHTLVRKGIARLLESDPSIQVAGEASDGLEALQLARELVPDVALLDIYMPGCDGITATRIIRQELPAVRVVILTVSEKEQNLFAALKSGAQGYLIKRIGPRELTDMVKAAARSEACISPAMAARIIAEFARQANSDQRSENELTPREQEVLALVAQGLSNKEVADILALSEHTVRNHLRNILEKLHLRNRVEAANYAVRSGLVPLPAAADPD